MLHKYTYKLRGLSIGCQPDDFVGWKQEEHRFETLYYDRKLSDKEVTEHELIYLGKGELKC